MEIGMPGCAPDSGGRSGTTSSAVAPPRSTLAEQVYQQLRFDIIHGVFQAGEAINEKVLAKRYHGSRTPVREAVMRLQQENLLRLVPNKGYLSATSPLSSARNLSVRVSKTFLFPKALDKE